MPPIKRASRSNVRPGSLWRKAGGLPQNAIYIYIWESIFWGATIPKTYPKPLPKPILFRPPKILVFAIYIAFWSNPPASNLVWHWNGKRVQLLNLYYDKELEGRLVSNATIDKAGLTTCFHLASICLCACVLPFSTSASRSLDTRVFFLLDIGFADAWHRLRVILDIGFALALTTL